MPADQSTRQGRAASSQRKSFAAEAVVDRTTREQYRFLDHCQEMKIECTVFTLAGATFIGIVYAHDRHFMLFGGRSKNAQPRLINKAFIAMIVPSAPVELFRKYRGLGTALSRKKAKRKGRASTKGNFDSDPSSPAKTAKLIAPRAKPSKSLVGGVPVKVRRKIEAPN